MIAEAIDRIAHLTRLGESKQQEALTTVVQLPFEGGLAEYRFSTDVGDSGARRLGEPIPPYYPDKLQLTTLTGLMDALRAGIGKPVPPVAPSAWPEKTKVLHVEDHLTVALVAAHGDQWGTRSRWIEAKHTPGTAFVFGSYYDDLAKFIIALQVGFLWTDELLGLIRVVSNLKAGSSITVTDDGGSTSVTLASGEVKAVEKEVKTRIKLVPLRSFEEINPVESEFLLRFRQNEKGAPSVALFNIDDTKWKNQTMQSIKKYLVDQLADQKLALAVLA